MSNPAKNWEDVYCVQAARIAELERENVSLRNAAVEICALARVWATVWGDKLSAESRRHLGQLEKRILKEVKP